MTNQTKITLADIDEALDDLVNVNLTRADWDIIRHAQHAKTPNASNGRWVIVGRTLLARLLCDKYDLKGFGQLTKAIRAGHDKEPDWDGINAEAGRVIKQHFTSDDVEELKS